MVNPAPVNPSSGLSQDVSNQDTGPNESLVRPVPQVASHHRNTRLRHLALHMLLSFGALFMILPFVWMLSTSLKAPADVFKFPPEWIPEPIMWSNYVRSWTLKPMGLAYFN